MAAEEHARAGGDAQPGAGGDERRAPARALARQALAEGAPTRWFEELYGAAAEGRAVVPWADLVPHPTLVRWLDRHGVEGLRVLVVGCGYGDDAEELARRGAAVTAFDVAPTAVRTCRERFPAGPVEYVVADAIEPPAAWGAAYDLVVEVNTLQVLPPAERARAGTALGRLVAPGGRLLVVARVRDEDEPEGAMPWPLTEREVRALGTGGLQLAAYDEVLDDEDPPVRRVVAVLERPGV